MLKAHTIVIGAVLVTCLFPSTTCIGEFDKDICSSRICDNFSNQSDKTDNDGDIKKYSIFERDQMSCTTCTLMSMTLKTKLKSLQREDMIEKILTLCSTLDRLSEPCANMVFNYFDDIFELLMHELQSNEICTLSGICTDGIFKMRSANLIPEKKIDEFYCAECKKIISHAQESLTRNITATMFKQKLLNKCKLAFRFQTECRTIVDQYYHEIYNMIKKNLNTDKICILVGVCPKVHSLDNLMEFSPEPKESNYILGGELNDSIKDLKLPQCFFCKNTFRVVKKMITKRMSNEKVKNAMHRACDKLGKLSNKCHDVINKHGDHIIRFARNPKVFCVLLGMCSPIGELQEYEMVGQQIEGNVLTHNAHNEVLSLIEPTRVSSNCNFCKNIIQSLKKLLYQHFDMKRALEHVCFAFFDQNLKYKCRNMLETHKHLIINLVSKNETHEQICRSLNMCLLLDKNQGKMHEETFPTSKDIKSKGGPKCAICKTMITTLKHMVPNGGNDKIKNALSHVCKKLRKGKHLCEDIVNKHTDQIVQLIAKHASSRVICKLIGMCSRPSPHELFTIVGTLSGEQLNILDRDDQLIASAECLLWHKVVKKLRKMVEHLEDRDIIQRAMGSVCHKLGMLSHKCEIMVQNHGNKIADLITKHLNGKRICKFFGIYKTLIEYENVGMPIYVNEFEDWKYMNNGREVWDILFNQSVKDELSMDTQPNKQLEGIQLEDLKQGPFCMICELLVTRFKILLDTKEKRNHILHSMLFTCDIFPKIIRQSCHEILLNYGYAVLDLLSKITPHDLCHFFEIHLAQAN